jgi:hypothetical protein
MIQLLVWGLIGYLIISAGMKQQDLESPIIAVSVTYLIYLISAFCSPMCSYLFHKHGADSIHHVMQNLFYNPPVITWHIQCYHYETRTSTTKDSKGHRRTHTSRHKVITYTEREQFNFYTWRDISGVFLLDAHKVFKSENKKYIKLALDTDFEFGDDLTRMDYQRQKDNFYFRNRWRDVHCSISETRTIPGFNSYNMIRISQQKASCVSGYTFILFTFLPFVELYKLYVDSFCVEQDYTIKKVISTRYDLTHQDHCTQWVQYVPTLVIFNQPQVAFNEIPKPMHQNPVLPSLEEINQAKQFNTSISFQNQPVEVYVPHFEDLNPHQQYSSLPMTTEFTQPMMTNFTQPNVNLQVNYNSSSIQLKNQNLNDKLI